MSLSSLPELGFVQLVLIVNDYNNRRRQSDYNQNEEAAE